MVDLVEDFRKRLAYYELLRYEELKHYMEEDLYRESGYHFDLMSRYDSFLLRKIYDLR